MLFTSRVSPFIVADQCMGWIKLNTHAKIHQRTFLLSVLSSTAEVGQLSRVVKFKCERTHKENKVRLYNVSAE